LFPPGASLGFLSMIADYAIHNTHGRCFGEQIASAPAIIRHAIRMMLQAEALIDRCVPPDVHAIARGVRRRG